MLRGYYFFLLRVDAPQGVHVQFGLFNSFGELIGITDDVDNPSDHFMPVKLPTAARDDPSYYVILILYWFFVSRNGPGCCKSHVLPFRVD